MEKHKSQALTKNCACESCAQKYSCFTQEHLFTDPLFQALFEALMAKGLTKELALDQVSNEIKSRLTMREWANQPSPTPDFGNYKIYTNPPSQPWSSPNVTISNTDFWDWGTTSNCYKKSGTEYDCSSVNYTMANGEEINLNVETDRLKELRVYNTSK
jgi:hypothetical protein